MRIRWSVDRKQHFYYVRFHISNNGNDKAPIQLDRRLLTALGSNTAQLHREVRTEYRSFKIYVGGGHYCGAKL